MPANTVQVSPVDRGVVLRPKDFNVYLAEPFATDDGTPGYGPEIFRADIIPQVLRWQANGALTSLTLRWAMGRSPDGGTSRKRPEHAGFAAGTRIILRSLRDGGIEDTWFVGNVGQHRLVIQANPDHEELTLTAYGPELLLENKVVSGQWHKQSDIDDLEIAGTIAVAPRTNADLTWSTTTGFRSDIAVIFNEHGKPNASESAWWFNTTNTVATDQKCKVFEHPDRLVKRDTAIRILAEEWTAYTALRSLVELVDGYDVIARETDWQTIEDLLKVPQSDGVTKNDVPIGQVNVEGKSLLEAIRAILLPVGYGFCLDPRPTVTTDSAGKAQYRYKLQVFSLHPEIVSINEDGTKLEPQAAVGRPHLANIAGGNVAITSDESQRSEVQRIEFLQDSHGAKNEVTVKGAHVRVQKVIDTLAGYPMWDTSTHSLGNWDVSNVIGPGSLPESGDYTGENWLRDYNVAGSASGAHNNLAKYPRVFRSFSWNEDASAEIKTYPDGGSGGGSVVTPPNLSQTGLDMGATNQYLRRPRAPGQTLTKVATQKTGGGTATQVQELHKAQVWFGIVVSGTLDEDSWIPIPATINRERAMITIKRDDILDWYPWAIKSQPKWHDTYATHTYATLLHNTLRADGATPSLKIRLVATFESDNRVSATAGRGTGSTWPFTSEKVIINERFKYDLIGDTWITGADTTARNDADPTNNIIADYASRAQDAAEDALGHCSIVLRGTTFAYPVGMAIPATSGRVVNLTVDGRRQLYAPVVVAMRWDMRENSNKTELLLDSPLLGLPA